MIKIINEDRKVLGSLYVIIPSDFSDLIGMCEGDASELLARMIPIGYEDELMDHLVEVFPDGVNIRDLNDYLSKEQDVIYQALGLSEDGEVLDEDTVRKSNGKWTNRGDDGEEHGEFKTKKEADTQRRAMFANGYKGESIKESKFDEPTSIGKGYAAPITTDLRRHRIKDDLKYINDENPNHSKVAKNDLVRAYNEILAEIEKVEEFDAYWAEHKKALMNELKAQLDLIPADIRD